MRPIYYLNCSLVLLFFTACRKDLLHWQQVQRVENAGTTQWNTAVFLPNGIGLLGGGQRFDSAAMMISSDYGATWHIRAMPSDSKGFFASCVAPGGQVYFAGLGLNICRSTSAMINYDFNRVAGPYEFPSAISYASKDHGIAVTNIGTDSGSVIHFDAELQFLGAQGYRYALHDIKMFDALRGIAVGSGVVLKTQDGGYHWQQLAITGDNFYRISALDSNRIFICGISGSIVKSLNGGQSWQRMRNGGNITLAHYQLWDILFTTEEKGYAVGEYGLVIYTDDGGTHWSEFDRFTQDHLRFIRRCPDGQLLIGGENGALYRLRTQ